MNSWSKIMVLAAALAAGLVIGFGCSGESDRDRLRLPSDRFVTGGLYGDIYITRFTIEGHDYIAAQGMHALALLHSQSCACMKKEGAHGKESR